MRPASDDEADKAAAGILEELLTCIRGFTAARYRLAQGVFHGRSCACLEGERRILAAGDFETRRWWVPTRPEHLDARGVRFVPERETLPDGERRVHRVTEVRSLDGRRWIRPSPENLASLGQAGHADEECRPGCGRGLQESIHFCFIAIWKILVEGLAAVERWAWGVLAGKVKPVKPATEAGAARMRGLPGGRHSGRPAPRWTNGRTSSRGRRLGSRSGCSTAGGPWRMAGPRTAPGAPGAGPRGDHVTRRPIRPAPRAPGGGRDEGGREAFSGPWPVTSFAATPLFPSPTFDRAPEDLLTREPRLATGGAAGGARADRRWEDPIRVLAATPSGSGRRCNMRLVSKYELKRLGLFGSTGEVPGRIPAGFESVRCSGPGGPSGILRGPG